MGIVYKAEDIKLRRTVALKFLPQEFASYPEAKERFLREAQAAAALDHAHICTIFEAEQAGGIPYIAMAYIEGHSLKERILKEPMESEKAVDIALQIANGLEAAHKKGIIHRDIKSGNVMITMEGQAKIMDFGLAKIAGELNITKEARTLGTVAYMSPEQARGEAVDQRTDIWSLGVVLYELLGGRLPFSGDHEASILYAIINEKPAPLTKLKDNLSPQLVHIVSRALEKDRDRRYQSVSEMAKDLGALLGELQTPAVEPRGFQRMARSISKPLIAIPLLIITLAASFLAYQYLHKNHMVRWAKNDGLPEVQRLLEAWPLNWSIETGYDNRLAIYRLAEKVERYIPKDPQLAKVLPSFSRRHTIETTPPGAKAYYQPYEKPGGQWNYTGVTPLKDLRLITWFYRWKFEKDGYEPILAVSLYDPKLSRALEKKGVFPSDMVFIPGRETTEEIGKMADFLIDKYEVTNRQYKKFVDAGGYRTKEYWKQRFIKNGVELTWEQAMTEFVDSAGRPGPATWQGGEYGAGQEDYPVSGVSWYEAAAYAEYTGKVLPTVIHWYMAAGYDLPYFSYNFPTYVHYLSNFRRTGPQPVGSSQSLSPFGAFDMAGNVREWCWNESGTGRYLRGGAWSDFFYMSQNRSHAPAFDRSPKNGFRCVREIDQSKVLKASYDPIPLESGRDFAKEKPVSDEIFSVYRGQFAYDKKELESKIESRDESYESMIVEKATFTAAYGNERMIAYLFIPKKASPAMQPVIFFPGNPNSVFTNNSKNLVGLNYVDFLVKNGRIVVYPIYKGTYERNSDSCNTEVVWPSERYQHTYTDYLIKWAKDIGRTIDYLETRPDIDKDKIAYYGWSWGARLGFVMLAAEKRFQAGILYLGGVHDTYARPEASEFNYVPRVKAPTLMLNGKYDMQFPFETSVKPVFDLLGAEQKALKYYETDHFIPMNELIKETLGWLDKYLGPTK